MDLWGLELLLFFGQGRLQMTTPMMPDAQHRILMRVVQSDGELRSTFEVELKEDTAMTGKKREK